MTRPHSRGVTIWMTGVSGKMPALCKTLATACATSVDLPKIEFSPAFTEALGRLSDTSKLFDNEVNHRPAG